MKICKILEQIGVRDFLNLSPICSIKAVEKCSGDEREPCEMHAKVVGAANQCEKHPKCA